MTITKVSERKTKNNHYRNWFIKEGLSVLYINTNHGAIIHMRHRLWDANEDDIDFENVVTDVPALFKEAIKSIY